MGLRDIREIKSIGFGNGLGVCMRREINVDQFLLFTSSETEFCF